MAVERTRRGNAGSLMHKLIEDEAEDEFYKTTYGGFSEDEEGDDYQGEEDDEDIFDSDFSVEEDDDVKSNDEDDEKAKRKRRKTVVKTFRQVKQDSQAAPKPRKPTRKSSDGKPSHDVESTRSLRVSTVQKKPSKSTSSAKTLKKHVPQLRRLTQQELLAEAKVTEEQNLASLAAFLKLEAEKKKSKIQKSKDIGPIIRYQSLTMPLFEDTGSQKSDEDCVLDEKETEKCSRNFLTFTDAKNFPKDYFPSKSMRSSVKPLCVVTKLPARYRDPLTGLPYANIEAFRIIREQYEKNRNSLEGMDMLTRRKRHKSSSKDI